MKSKVFIIKTSSEKIIAHYQKLVKETINWQPQPTIIKLNLSWSKFYPACSSPPWQFEGVIKGLLDLGFSAKDIIPVENRTVVTNVYQGARNHGWDKVAKKYGVKIHYLVDEKYIQYRPKAKMLVMDKIFEKGIYLPEIIFNKPLISLCTLKTHVFTKTTGVIKNYFGMLNTRRHWAHRFIDETIVDLLQIQKELHPHIAALMDGSVVGYGSGPRAMKIQAANLILGSQDEVALDSVAAKIIGFNPSTMKYLKLAKELNLGENNLNRIKIIGIKQLPNFMLSSGETFASRGQKLIYHKMPWQLEKLLLHTFIAPWSYLASRLYHDVYWYNFIGRKRIREYMKTEWGRLFRKYNK